MAEVVGLAASAVTLAALFSKCIDCFSYFKAAQNCSEEAKTLLVKLDCEKARLLVWANTVGILHTDQQGRYPQLADLEQEVLIRRCFDQIISLFTDAQKLQVEYGGRPTVQGENQHSVAVMSVNSMDIFKATKRKFFARAGELNETPNWMSRVKWAIRDGAKFRILLSHLKDFVDNVIELVPVPLNIINSTVEENIMTIIDIDSLRLAESACEESYPSWSTRASEVIRESEIGTLDRRNIEETIRDVDEPELANEEPTSINSQRSSLSSSFSKKTWIVCTDKCLDSEPASHCDPATIGGAILSREDYSFTCPNKVRWNLGRRILNNVKSPFESQEAMSKFELDRLGMLRKTGDSWNVNPVSMIYIHCGPCVCAIHTAMKLTVDNGIPGYFEYAIRIDERLPTSCRRSSSAIDVLTAIHDAIDGHVVTYTSKGKDKDGRELKSESRKSKSIGFIDCPELEKRIYDLEQEQSRHFYPSTILQTIMTSDYQNIESNLPIGAVIFIVETDLCHLSIDSHQFRSEARQPRESDIFCFEKIWSGSVGRWKRKYMGSYSRSPAITARKRAKPSLFTNRNPPPSPTSSVIATATQPFSSNKRSRSESMVDSEI